MSLAWPVLALAFARAAAGDAGRSPPLLVVVDPGHGGASTGAVGPDGLREKDLALSIARRVAARCQKELSARVLLTRTGDRDLPLAERVALANRKRASVFVSIHANSMPTARSRRFTKGIETYFLSADASGAAAAALAERENLEDRPHTTWGKGHSDVDAILDDLALNAAHSDASRLAYALQQRLVAATGAEDHGVQQAPFFVLTGARMPAVLIEVGFISNADEEKQLARPAYQDQLAEAIVRGIADYELAVAPRTAVR
ncbi:MAG TPA: N-acetylmuramoyl-L-alanine amidase [Myxococcales bacterium]|nr:N-acetylmuramoyl-L-alanine amidase [Myxococcales bacterium]